MRIKEDDKKKEQEVIEIQADVRVGEYILEKGDKIVIMEMDKDDDSDDDSDDDDKKKKKKKDDDDEKDEKKEAIIKKIQDGKHLTIAEKKYIIGL